MKKLIITTCSLFFVLGLSAQTDAGSILVSANGEIKFESTKIVDADGYSDTELDQVATTNTTTAEMAIGYFVANNVALGAILGYSASKITQEGYEDYEGPTTIAYGAFLRYYIGGIAFVGANYQMINVDDGFDDGDLEPKMGAMAGEAGFSLFLSENVAFTPRATYTLLREEIDGVGLTTGRLGITAGLAIHF